MRTTTARPSALDRSRTRKQRRPIAATAAQPAAPPAAAASLPPAAGQARPDALALFDLLKQPGYYNSRAKAALLRRSSAPPHDELLVDFSGEECYVELRACGAALVAGSWKAQAAVAGLPLTAIGRWEESCWETDEDGDYLEIELPLSAGWTLQRQMLLARKDRFLLLADALLGPPEKSSPGEAPRVNGSDAHVSTSQAQELHYVSSLCLDPRAALRPAAESREGWLVANNRRWATVMPLALPEWRAEFCHARLAAESGQMLLEQRGLGRNLYAPLWFDLDPRRMRRPLTWRRITVGENLAAVPRDAAAAFRVQAGREQWFVYRSLAKPGNRSVLGHNTLYEFICHRFLPTGESEALVEIE